MRGTRVARRWTVCGVALAVLLPAGSGGPAGAADADPACAGATIVGTDGDDVLRGTDGPDVIDGLAGDDRILGLGGDDVLCGGPGQDRLVGGAGDDGLHGGADAKVAEDTDYYVYYGDTLAGGPGDDLLDPGGDPRHDGSVDTLTFAGADAGITLDLRDGTAAGDGSDTITSGVHTVVGTGHDDDLRGDDGRQTLVGGGGRDLLVGRGGKDTLAGGRWAEGRQDHVGNVLRGGPGGDELLGSLGDDLLRGGPGRDLLQADRGRDRSSGGSGDDSFSDYVEAGGGQSMRGGSGRDTFNDVHFYGPDGRYQRHAVGRVDLAAGVTTARFPAYSLRMPTRGLENASTPRGDSWTVIGTAGPNEIIAGFFSDPVRLFGRGGDDQVWGSDRDDLLDGGPGHDEGGGWGGHDRIRSIEHLHRR